MVWLACSYAKTTPAPYGSYGWLQIDQAQLISLGPYLLPAQGGELVHTESVPLDPGLIGCFFCVQPVELRGNRWRIGNFVETWVGR